MIRCEYYFNTDLIDMFIGDPLRVLEIVNRFLHKDAISVQLPLESICNHRKVRIKHYKEALRHLQDKNILFDWKWILGDNCPHIIVPDGFYLVNPKYIRHINKTQFKKYLKYTERKLLDDSRKHIVNEYWAVNLVPEYSGDEFGGIYVSGYNVVTKYNPDTINKPIFSDCFI